MHLRPSIKQRLGCKFVPKLEVLEDRIVPVAYSVAKYMNWGTTAPKYASNVAYTSGTTWQGIKVVNYSPSHYVDFNSSGQLVFADGSTLDDTTFQTNLPTDSPWLNANASYGVFVNYLQGNPAILIYNDLVQLQAAGFQGVRLYGDPPQAVIATILAAKQLSATSGSQFYVELEVAVPDLSKPAYIPHPNGNSPKQGIQNLYKNQIFAGSGANTANSGPEGGLQQLHYVINIVGAATFSTVVPLVFFSHEDLVQPKGNNSPLTPGNCSAPLLQWGINATRALLKKELAGQAALPTVTTALVAGQVVDVSTANHAVLAALMATIQTDPNAPIAYDVYPFQWANIYFDVTGGPNGDGTYPYDNGAGVIANAFPANAAYHDRTVGWTTGAPPNAANFTVQQAVTEADLMWSLQWMQDRVNWIWNSGGPGPGTTNQLVAETGWASAQNYTQAKGAGKQVTGTQTDAQNYFNAVLSASFQIGNAPVMYFAAYDEPVKESNTAGNANNPGFSENHYGIYGWTALPKFFTDPVGISHPLTAAFGIVTLVANNAPNGYTEANRGQNARSAAFSYQLNSGPVINVPWFWGSVGYSDGAVTPGQGSVTWMPSPSVLLGNGDTLSVTSLKPDTLTPVTFTLTFDDSSAFASAVTYSPSASGWPPNLELVSGTTAQGSNWEFQMSFSWLHGNPWPLPQKPSTKFPAVYQDFWALPTQRPPHVHAQLPMPDAVFRLLWQALADLRQGKPVDLHRMLTDARRLLERSGWVSQLVNSGDLEHLLSRLGRPPLLPKLPVKPSLLSMKLP